MPDLSVGVPIRRAIGLMSGTSMDGVDVALIESDGESAVSFGPTGFEPYEEDERALLRAALADAAALTERAARPGVLATAEEMITQRHARAVERFLSANAIERDSIAVIGFHGQTVLHRPKQRLTVQIGDGEALAGRLGIPTIYDLRAADVTAGGEGAPIAPVYHRALVEKASLAVPVALLNVGGVANVTFVSGGEREPIAGDTGPGNALIDDLMLARTGEPVDRDGAMAARGRVDENVLRCLLDHPFFDSPPPKSLDRNDFSRAAVDGLSTEDAAATLTAFTAGSVARLLPHLPAPPRQLIVCGGGARNPTLMRELARRMPCPVVTAEACGWSADAIEAQAFAYLALRSLRGLPLTFPGTTGVAKATRGGIIAMPRPDQRKVARSA
ncbi:MAG: anhydro-N-acetylmuramic acid kinase [Methylobacteriaceae bacterium]|nr:anhydro-N-acetylmuramic acid kinase [Methylobacteriaceae bacterium]MBV9245404.1 anhydro-N-acetylmuramic acid kinase [Methylobacteriaceae bacterium]